MKELLILSGKGGTGKTTITGAFAYLAKDKVLVDCDVDASDLHLILNTKIRKKSDFISGVKAKINQADCSGCNLCIDLCQFNGIIQKTDVLEVDEFSCEGCGVCAHFCPDEAIELLPNHCGFWYVSDTTCGPLVHAELMPGEENSGKLVSLVKNKARELAEKLEKKFLLIDGPPGIGCPVISSISGASLIIMISEPTLSGLHDLRRVLELARHFKVAHGVIINKWDLNAKMSDEIERFCSREGITFLGKIPFDKTVVEALTNGKNIMEFKHCKASESIANIWLQVEKKL